MADFLTEKNGVVCRSCFFIIDLTDVKTEEYPKMVRIFSRFMGKPDWFRVICPHCNKRGIFDYSEVRPISNLKGKLDEANKQFEDDTTNQFRRYDVGN